MNVRPTIAASVLALAVTACAAPENADDSDGSWVGTITTEGDVTTVVNESGSVWGGTARLVEEASIGVEAGDDEYMLGAVGALWATDDEIYVIDTQLPAVRVYDRNGRYLRNVGSAGQGPGEYVRPSSVYVDRSGLVYVHDTGAERMNVYGADGVVDTWAPTEGSRLLSDSLLVTRDGRFFARDTRWLDMTDPSKREEFMQEVGPEGPIGEEVPQPAPDFEPATLVIRLPGRTATWGIPFMPYEISRFLPTEAWAIGVPDDYRFEIRHPDGGITRVRKYWEPIPVSAEEAAYQKQWTLATVRAQVPDFAWNGPEVPDIKPAFQSFIPTFDDRVLVLRQGPSRRVEPCDERFEDRGSSTEACFEPTYAWDVFELTGRYLGELERPEGRLFRSFFHDDLVLLAVEDEAGTIVVKRYRLVLPGEE